MTNKAGWSLST